MTTWLATKDLGVNLAGTPILRGITAALSPGEFVGVIGPNGAGKSTLLRALAHTLRPSTGEITLDGAGLERFAARALAQRISTVPQSTQLSFAFTVAEVVLMGRHPHLGRFAVEGEKDTRIAAEALELTGMTDFADRDFLSLSGGERQLVLLAKALAQQPQVLLLDEPISALDIRHQLAVLRLVAGRTRAGLLAVAALHDLNLAARFCSRLMLVGAGRVLADGSPHEVLTPQTLRTAYGVQVVVRTDPDTGALVVTALDVEPLPTPIPATHEGVRL